MTWSSIDKKMHSHTIRLFGEWKSMIKTDWESCFTWPFVLYRFHCDHCRTVWLLCEIIIHGHSDGLSTFLISTSTFSSSASQFTVCSLFSALFFGMQDEKLYRSVRITHKPMRKVRNKNTKQKLSVESKCTLMVYSVHRPHFR